MSRPFLVNGGGHFVAAPGYPLADDQLLSERQIGSAAGALQIID
jgi:hypothetical protein